MTKGSLGANFDERGSEYNVFKLHSPPGTQPPLGWAPNVRRSLGGSALRGGAVVTSRMALLAAKRPSSERRTSGN